MSLPLKSSTHGRQHSISQAFCIPKISSRSKNSLLKWLHQLLHQRKSYPKVWFRRFPRKEMKSLRNLFSKMVSQKPLMPLMSCGLTLCSWISLSSLLLILMNLPSSNPLFLTGAAFRYVR